MPKEKKKEQPAATEQPSVPAVIEQPKAGVMVEVKPPEPLSVEIDKYRGVSESPVSDEARRILATNVDPNDVEIRPDGVLYYPEIKYRKVLNEAFGPGGWALVPRDAIRMDNDNSVMTREYALFVNSRFFAEARGQQLYHEKNKDMTYADAAEGVKSNALMRCCKDLGIAWQLWDPNFINQWIQANAVKVWVDGKDRPLWRRKDRPAFWKEKGPVDDRKAQAEPQQAPQQAQQPANGKSGLRVYAETASHKKLRALIEGYVNERKLPAGTCGDILVRLTTWTDKEKKVHEGVREINQISEKQAIIAISRYNEAVANAKKKKNGEQDKVGPYGN